MSTTTDRNLSALAEKLGLPEEPLYRLGVTRNGRGYKIPERNGDGEIIGHATRSDDGSKGCVTGSKRGLTMPYPLDPYDGATSDDPILVVEGMSDTAAGLSLGFATIGRPSATGGIEHLKIVCAARHVCIVGENDSGAGRAGAQKAAEALYGVAASVRVIFPPDDVKDLRKWITAPAPPSRDELLRIIDDTPEWRPDPTTRPGPVLVRLADVAPAQIEWLWEQRVAIGKLTLIAGDPGLGKSFLTIDMAARVSIGAGWPDRPGDALLGKRPGPGGVVMLSAEDDVADTMRPRLDAAGGDPRRVAVLQAVRTIGDTGEKSERTFDLARDLRHLEDAIDQTPGCRLVVIDPISAYLGKTDSHNNGEVRGLLAPLADLAARRRVALVCVTHLNKGQGQAIYRAMGSLAFAAAARAVWGVVKDKDEPSRRLLLPIKNNIGNDRSGLAYTLRPTMGGQPQVAWEPEPIELTADDALSSDSKPGPDADERPRCEAWLRQALQAGPRPARDVEDEGVNGESFSVGTIRRAKKTTRVVAYRPENPGPWFWRLP